jgi:hypothetical protein
MVNMSRLSSLQCAAVVRLQRQFKAAANTHGPLRCVLIHKEGDDSTLRLSPPQCEDMPALPRGAFYSYRLYCRGTNGEEVPCKTATIGTGRNGYIELDASRQEPFAGRDIYLLRNHKDEEHSWPIDRKVLLADPNWKKLYEQTQESKKVFWRLAAEVGRCFGAQDCGTFPEVARESFEARDDGERWLWIVFDLAWQKVRGSPLQADRSIWHEIEGGDQYFYAWELNTDSFGGGLWEAWAKRRPQFYYSSLDDLFSASVSAIDLLTVRESAMVNSQQEEILALKPGIWGMSIDLKALWRWICKHLRKKRTIAK